MHDMAFVITDVNVNTTRGPEGDPPTSDLRQAAEQAVQMALDHIEQRQDGNYPESLDIGSYSAYAYIQGRRAGQYRPDSEHCTWAFWSQLRGRKEQEDDSLLDRVVAHHWRNSSRLIELALMPPHDVPHREWFPIVPRVALFPDREPVQIFMQFLDVFGEDQDAIARPNIASRHLRMDSYSQAHHLARAPMDQLNQAQHRIEYIRAIEPYQDRIAIQLDWNL